MAKNKNNRDRKQSASARAPQAAADQAVMDREEQHAPPLSSGDMPSRKRQKRFGHN
ncbi:hypothetical protein [Streptomyces sp. NPDC004783]|uniref:hypothetical protein n=1 Tax=unclassified Streptomyces TaxID=2593676 RepID=UPI0033A3B9E5